MFLDQPAPDYSLEQWESCRDFYLLASRDKLLPENVLFACRSRARIAAGKVRQALREIEDLELLWS
jgi:hypothetical protein